MLRPAKNSRYSDPLSRSSATATPRQACEILKVFDVIAEAVCFTVVTCFAVFSKRCAVRGHTVFHARNVGVGVIASVV